MAIVEARDLPRKRVIPATWDLLETIYRSRVDDLHAIAVRFSRHPSAAEDLVHEAFVRTYAARPHVAGPSELFAYLARTVINLCNESMRKDARWQRAAHRIMHRELSDPISDAPLQDDPLLESVRRLSDRQREIILLRFWFDMSVAETAATLSISEGSVKKHSGRAFLKLRPALESESNADE